MDIVNELFPVGESKAVLNLGETKSQTPLFKEEN